VTRAAEPFEESTRAKRISVDGYQLVGALLPISSSPPVTAASVLVFHRDHDAASGTLPWRSCTAFLT
jgi:hypothetical protein